ncbi:alpha-L-rhamnosidase [Paenibacillus sacheonensis]|uniref:alpha-L-rhamnosidase n=1 Tax=Paenibacillus sacheonensis TaxID=742054 RepID=A0A7X4YPZ6_9BACL|nr:alpha-L-rhamnosidase [Paenibacillus sacheonensis]MBM7566169.1 alpha-L-rhamnosidase [Paenibacillus sacheonensis]NBC70377.1 family 78 glycoside hydrolase catalytic domain [Paenibacillus sacheonensis]
MHSIIPTNLKTEYLYNPLGIDSTRPRLSWMIETKARGFLQSAYRILVSTDIRQLLDETGNVWDSGKVESEQSVFVPYGGAPLRSNERYYWKVRVWDTEGNPSVWSETAEWSMGLLSRDDWKAEWIGEPFKPVEGNREAGFFRKSFAIGKPIREATIYATAFGAIEISLNGSRVGEDYFAPEWTDYHTRVHYRTYDVTSLLREGPNAVGTILGEGWYSGHIAWYGKNLYGEALRFMLQLYVRYEDGTEETIVSDASWKESKGPILFSDFLMGESYDARLEHRGWNEAGFDDSAWRSPHAFGGFKGWIQAQISPPIRVMEVMEQIAEQKLAPGTRLVDIGQNMVGWARIRLMGDRGSAVTLRYAEVLNPDGSIYTDNLRTAKQTDTYILKGEGEEIYEPRFTFHGFRYVEITASADVNVLQVTGRVIHNAMKPTGRLVTSDAGVNRLFSNIQWTQRANFISVPTDCPQRDERMGWTGDAQIFSRTATYNMDAAGFFAKYMTDIADAQRKTGAFTDTAPFLKGFSDWSTFVASAGWADAGVIIPWTMYGVYEDRRIIEEHYDAMAAWMAYLVQMNPSLLRTDTQYYGDWLSLNANTPMDVFATAYFAYCAKLMAEMSEAVGRAEQAASYAALFDRIRSRFNEAFVTEDGRIAGETQTGYAMALFMDLLPQDTRRKAASHLAADIEQRGWHITTGIHGIKYLLPVLCEVGYEDAAYRLLLQDTYPSWLYSVRNGATTIWERWDGWTEEKGFQNPGMNSFNHYALGAVGEWMFRYMGGIDRRSDTPGYKHIQIRPFMNDKLAFVDCRYESSYGTIRNRWSIEGGAADIQVTIPPNTKADIHIPHADGEPVYESGRPIPDGANDRAGTGASIIDLGIVGDRRVFQVGSGDYHFRTRLGASK